MPAVIAVFLAQVFYTAADSLQKYVLKGRGFSLKTLLSVKFLLTLIPAGIGFVLLMYGLSKMDISKTIILLGVFGVVLAAASGIIFFGDRLTVVNWVGVTLAILAIVLVHWK